MSILGSRIRFLREKKGWNQKRLSKELHVGHSTLCQYESGKRIPSDGVKIAIAKLFGVSVDYLIGNDIVTELSDITLYSDNEPSAVVQDFLINGHIFCGETQLNFLKEKAEDGIYLNCDGIIPISKLIEALNIFEEKLPTCSPNEIRLVTLPHGVKAIRKISNDTEIILINDQSQEKQAPRKPTSPLKMKEAKPIETGMVAEGGAKGTRSVADPDQLADHLDQAEEENI